MSISYPGSLHNHTQFSNLRLRDCIIKENDLIDYAIELGHKVVAITDHETIASWVKVEKYYDKIKKEHPDFKVIRGNEIYLCRDGLNAENFNKEVDRYYHFILLAKDREGAKQIMEISTRAWHRSYMARGMRRVPTYYQDLVDIIGANPGHVILSSACLGGVLPTQILRGTSDDKLINWIAQMQLLAGKENFYLEMQPSHNKEQVIVNKKLLELSRITGAKYIITTDSHYLKKEDRKIHKAYLNAQNGDREVDDFYATTYMMSDEEIRSFFQYFSKEEIEVGYRTIEEIVGMCEDFTLRKPLYIPNLKWKEHLHDINLEDWYAKIPLFKTFMESDYFGDRELVYAIIDGINHKQDLQNEKAYAEINSNLDMIWTSSEVNKAHWSAYLLNLQNIIDLCWVANSIVGVGRGCFIPGSKVLLADGREKNIQDIIPGDKVFTQQGNIKEVEKRLEYDCAENLYKIYPQTDTKNPIVCTNNHEIWGMKSSFCPYDRKYCSKNCSRRPSCKRQANFQKGWIKAEELSEADFIFYPRPKYQKKVISYYDLANFIKNKNSFIVKPNSIYSKAAKKTFSRFINIDKEFLYVLGVAIGDGWTSVNPQKSYLGLAFNSENEKDKRSLERCLTFFENLNMSVGLIKHAQKKLIQMYVYCAPVGVLFENLIGHGVENKHIPNELLYDNKEEMYSLFEGLMASDGSYDKEALRISYDGINHNLISQIKNLWGYLGIYGSIVTREAHGNNKTSYKLRASGKQLNWLIKQNNWIFQKPSQVNNNLIIEDDGFYFRIKKIETEYYTGKVYDLTVSQDHSYIINNISVHNSGVGFLLLYVLDITQINPLRETTKTFAWRFLNPVRVSPLDVDFDIEGTRRADVLKTFRQYYGEDRVSNVATFRAEKSKSAILTAARGLGIDVDVAQYIAGLVPADRGQIRTLSQCFYGDEENDWPSVKQFVYEMTNNYPELWEVAQKIEGLICGMG